MGWRGRWFSKKSHGTVPFKITVARELHAKNNKYFKYCDPDFSRTRESNLSKEQFWQRRGEEDISIEIYAAKGSHISGGGGGGEDESTNFLWRYEQ